MAHNNTPDQIRRWRRKRPCAAVPVLAAALAVLQFADRSETRSR